MFQLKNTKNRKNFNVQKGTYLKTKSHTSCALDIRKYTPFQLSDQTEGAQQKVQFLDICQSG